MQNISDFFKRIGGIYSKEIALRSIIRSIIKEFIGIELSLSAISIKSSTVNLKNIKHSARSSIFINKNKIINKINNLQSAIKITDIR